MLRLITMVILIVLCVWVLAGDLNTAIVFGESVWKFVKACKNFITAVALIFLILTVIIKCKEYSNKFFKRFF